MNERDKAVTTSDDLLLNVAEPMDEVTTDDFDMNIESTLEENADAFETDGGGEDGISDSIEGDIDGVESSDEFTGEEDLSEGLVDDYFEEESDSLFEEGDYMDSNFDEGMYVDPGFDEGMYMDPGMEMGMGEVKDPLLSSWPFVIGISAAVLVVSIVIGALLAKLRIKKGIDLYED